eukprot:541061-Pelagomonas_calceolata.AAC.1
MGCQDTVMAASLSQPDQQHSLSKRTHPWEMGKFGGLHKKKMIFILKSSSLSPFSPFQTLSACVPIALYNSWNFAPGLIGSNQACMHVAANFGTSSKPCLDTDRGSL